MKTFSPDFLARVLCGLAGAMDTAAGLGLMLIPTVVLPLMFVAVPGPEALIFLRFVGAFVAAVGITYLWALAAPAERLRVVLGATIIFRIAAGSYSLCAILLGHLSPMWLSVPATDFGLAVAQSLLLRRGAGRSHHD
jgi:hypothetical protein